MLNNRQVPIQKPIHTILRASLLTPFQLPTSNRPRNAFLPTDIGQIVDGCAIHMSADYFHTFSNPRMWWCGRGCACAAQNSVGHNNVVLEKPEIMRSSSVLTLLDSGFLERKSVYWSAGQWRKETYLGLVGNERLQLLLVTVRQLAEIDIGRANARSWVHDVDVMRGGLLLLWIGGVWVAVMRDLYKRNSCRFRCSA